MTEKNNDDLPGDDLDDLLDLDDNAAREALKREIRTRGAVEAYKAALDVARDKSAPAPARATSAGLIMRSAGLLNGRFVDEDNDDPNSIDSATAAELNQALAYVRAKARRAERSLRGQPDEEKGQEQPHVGSSSGVGALD